MEYMLWIWVAIIAITAIAELFTVQMISIWFTVGSFAAIIAYAAHAPYWAQIVVFFVISVICLAFFRKLSMKWLLRNVKGHTNANSLIGKTTRLLSDITEDEDGTLQFSDVVWTAIGLNGFTATAGTRVEVVEIRGNKLVVKSAEIEESKSE